MSMITTERELRELVNLARNGEYVALDTEFIWERTYFPRLGLIQMAVADESCHLIDPLAIADLSVLGSLLADPAVVKILHDAPQDLAILTRITGGAPTAIFDTRIAAGFAGLSAFISLSELIATLLDIELPKSQTRTNWLARPLDQKQVDYALDDVRYLGALRVLLLSRIIVPEIRSWLQSELELLCNQHMAADDEERFRKIKGIASLGRRHLALLRQLAAWREQEARRQDRPRGHIISDANLVKLAANNITSAKALKESKVLPPGKLRRYEQAILDCGTLVLNTPATRYPERERQIRLKANDKTIFERLVGYIQLKCELQGIDPHLVGNTSELKQLAKNITIPGAPLPTRLTEGWRRKFLDDFFRQRSAST